METAYLCNAEKLRDFCADLFAKNGFDRDDGKAIAAQLINADMRGVRSHGVVRVEMYLTQKKKGAINCAARPEIIHETPVAATIDGHGCAGAVACELAVKTAREKAQKSGMSMVVVRNSNHFGTCGNWATKIAQDDMIAFATTNSLPLLAAPVSKKAVIGNNPIAIAVPAEGKCMCLDMSNGVMAFGKIHEYRRLNKPLPENAWLNKNGEPTTDPFANEFLEFISLPVGMHKGFGLAVMAEAVSSVLADGPVAADIVPEGMDSDQTDSTAHCFVAVSLKNFCEPEEYRARAERFIDYLRHAEVRSEGDRVFYPGEIENMAYEASVKNGIEIPSNIKEYLCEQAAECDLLVPDGLFIER